jgi:hypothetical protein
MFDDYINQHSRQDAQRLGGAYGIKAGVVQILPVSRATDVTDITDAVDVKVICLGVMNLRVRTAVSELVRDAMRYLFTHQIHSILY